MALPGKCGSGFGELKECHRSLYRSKSEAFYYFASLPLEVAQLQVFLAAFLLGEEGAEGVEFSFGWVPLASNVHLVVATVDEVWGDGSGKPLWAWRWRYEAEADVALQSVAVGAAGGRPS